MVVTTSMSGKARKKREALSGLSFHPCTHVVEAPPL